MAGPPGPHDVRPEDMLHDPATQPPRVCAANKYRREMDASFAIHPARDGRV